MINSSLNFKESFSINQLTSDQKAIFNGLETISNKNARIYKRKTADGKTIFFQTKSFFSEIYHFLFSNRLNTTDIKIINRKVLKFFISSNSNEAINKIKTVFNRILSSISSLPSPFLEKIKTHLDEINQVPSATTPLFLKNYYNRCYLDSVLDMMLSQDSIRQKIFDEYIALSKECMKNLSQEEKTTLIRKKDILEKLYDLILIVDETKGKGKDEESPLGKNSPAEKVREAIFESGLNYDLNGEDRIYYQQDAASVFLLINELLDNKINLITKDTAISSEIKKEVFAYRQDTHGKLELRFKNTEKQIEKQVELKEMLDEFFSLKNQETEKRNFDLGDGTKLKNVSFSTQTKLQTPPDSLTLHLSRFKYDANKREVSKVKDSVILPKDGMIEMTPYCVTKNSEIYRYEITGYVIHTGTYSVTYNEKYEKTKEVNNGHYIANVKIGDKFYVCNNEFSFPYHKEISAQEFYGNPNAYLVMLKRIPNG